jgi:hypothetical protein
MHCVYGRFEHKLPLWICYVFRGLAKNHGLRFVHGVSYHFLLEIVHLHPAHQILYHDYARIPIKIHVPIKLVSGRMFVWPVFGL